MIGVKDAGNAEPESFANKLPVLAVRDLTVRFENSGEQICAVRDVSFDLDAGGALAIVGESGSGKSVTCRAVLGLLPGSAHVSGSARFLGSNLIGLDETAICAFRGSSIGITYQDGSHALNPTMKIGKQIAEVIHLHRRAGRRDAWEAAIEWLRSLGVPQPDLQVSRYPHELSGGMRQRVLLAIAIAAKPKVLIADEITRGLDIDTQAGVLDQLRKVQREHGMAIVLVCHDLGVVEEFVDEILVMNRGMVFEYAPARRLIDRPATPYSEALLAAWSQRTGSIPDAGNYRLEGLPLENDLASCPFFCRCPRRKPICFTERPVRVAGESRSYWACWNPGG